MSDDGNRKAADEYVALVRGLYPSITERVLEQAQAALDNQLQPPGSQPLMEDWLVLHVTALRLQARRVAGPWVWLAAGCAWARLDTQGAFVAEVSLPRRGKPGGARGYVYAPGVSPRPTQAGTPQAAAAWCDLQLESTGLPLLRWCHGPIEPGELRKGLDWFASQGREPVEE